MGKYNTIILVHGECEVEEKGDAIFGIDNNAKEVCRWEMSEIEAAKAELAKHRCTYRKISAVVGTVVQADEWALEFCECDEDGEYIGGADYELAQED